MEIHVEGIISSRKLSSSYKRLRVVKVMVVYVLRKSQQNLKVWLQIDGKFSQLMGNSMKTNMRTVPKKVEKVSLSTVKET